MTEPTAITTAQVLVLFAKELAESDMFDGSAISELVIHAGKSLIDNDGLSVKRND